MSNVQDLRKIYSAQGIKGFSSANRAIFTAAFEADWDLAIVEDAARKPVLTAEQDASVNRVVAALDAAFSAAAEQVEVFAEEMTARPKMGKSRAGMVIIAKGSEVHKSEVFKIAAQAAGWTVTITSGGEDHFYADAHKDGNAVQLAWEGRAYDYHASSATFGGKSRKVRNLKEALRLL